MMIEINHAIVADIAVADPLGPEDHAGFAELHPIELRGGTVGGDMRHIEKVDTLGLDDDVAISPVDGQWLCRVEVLQGLNLITYICWNDSWIYCSCHEHGEGD
jgi:hypothetical protein